MLTALDHALRYASQGLPVFPVWPALQFKPGRFVCGCPSGLRCRHPAKHPLGSLARNGRNDATIDEAKIRDWWTVWPNANISIATGNGLVVVDIDPRHGGDVTLAELEATHGKLPQSWRVLVRKGLTDGQRNEEVTRLAGHLLRRYVDPIVVLELMLAFNDARGRPPLTSDEVTETVNKIAKRELKRRQASS